MHFLREALYRKPLESNYLVYGRAVTAMTMAVLFLCFCGFLISQIYFDQYLIETSSEQILNDIDTPDIEVCVQNSTLSIVKCDAMYYNWTVVDVPNCWQRFFRQGDPEPGPSKCYVFETNNTYRMATGLTYDNRPALRRLDFYWNINSVYNLSFITASIPTITVQLYDPHFSFWKKYTLGKTKVEEETITNLRLGATRATSIFNYTSNIFYFPQKYRAIRPFDAASIIGFKPGYIDIMTLNNYQHNWPLEPNPPSTIFNRSRYHGLFSVQLGQSTIDVKTEVRQYTLLASVALAGGCYGVLTTIYILLFGMTRLTPWGLVHHIPVLINKRKPDYLVQEQKKLDADHAFAATKRDSILIPWKDDKKRNSTSSDVFLRFKRADSSSKAHEFTESQLEENLMELDRLDKDRLEELSTRVQELEIILTEYFIDTAYLDNIRHRQNIFTIPTSADDSSDQINKQ